MAALIGKLIILLIPILGVLYPMTRLLPRLYDWVMRAKVLRMYGELRLLEDEMANARGTGLEPREMIARLNRLEEQASHLRMPVAYASMLYMLRNHIDLVREDLKAVLVATNLIVGRCTASAVASASRKSFFCPLL